MNKNIVKLFLLIVAITLTTIVLSSVHTLAQANIDMQTIKNRLYSSLLSTTADPTTILTKWKTDGTFSNIDYNSTSPSGWSPSSHLEYARTMLVAYSSPGNSYYQNADLLNKIVISVKNWAINDYQCSTNWWYNDIDSPNKTADILTLIPDNALDATTTAKLYEIARRAYIPANHLGDTGANLSYKIVICTKIAAITNDDTYMRTLKEYSKELFLIYDAVDLEGIKPDYSFQQHLALFQTLYSDGFNRDIRDLLYLLKDTEFILSNNYLQTYVNYLLDGQKWIFKGDYPDITLTGRAIAFQTAKVPKAIFNDVITTLLNIDGIQRKDELKAFMTSRLGAVDYGFTGAKHFWNSDYTSLQRTNFHFGVRASSVRTKPSEMITGVNKKGYYLADGATNIMQNGAEYVDIPVVWDWNKIPGTTTPQGALKNLDTFDSYHWHGNTEFVGGASDGAYAVSAMDYNKDGLQAKKSWFMLDEGMVALGSGIKLNQGRYNVTTSVNQTQSLGDVYFSDGQTVKKIGFDYSLFNYNLDFENGNVSWPWTVWSNATISNSNSHSGNYCGKVSPSGSLTYNFSRLKPNTTYKVTIWAKIESQGSYVLLSANNYGGNKLEIRAEATDYTKYELQFTTGSTNTTAQIGAYKVGGTIGASYIDDISILAVNDGAVLIDGDHYSTNSGQTTKPLLWVSQNNVGYVFLNNIQTSITNNILSGRYSDIDNDAGNTLYRKNVFGLFIEHGQRPENGNYSYMVLPNKSISELDSYAKNKPILLLNTVDKQAVWHKDLKMLQSVFWSSGTIKLPDGTFFTADNPCILIAQKIDANWKVTVSNPKNQQINVNVSIGNSQSKISYTKTFILPRGGQAGNSITAIISQDVVFQDNIDNSSTNILSATTSADIPTENQDNNYVNANYDTLTTGDIISTTDTAWANKTYDGDTFQNSFVGGSVKVVEDPSASDKSFKMTIPSATTGGYLRAIGSNIGANTDTNILLQTRIKIGVDFDSATGNNFTFGPAQQSGSNWWDGTNTVKFYNDGTGNKISWGGNGSNVIGTWTKNNWYDIQLLYQLDTNMCKLYIKGDGETAITTSLNFTWSWGSGNNGNLKTMFPTDVRSVYNVTAGKSAGDVTQSYFKAYSIGSVYATAAGSATTAGNLTANYTLINSGAATTNYYVIIVLYNSSKKLIKTTLTTVNLPASSSAIGNVVLTVSSDDAKAGNTAKAFIWNKATLVPLIKSIPIN